VQQQRASTAPYLHVPTEPASDVWLAFTDAAYYTVSLGLGYLLMLLFMTYNVWLCLLVLLGCGLSHFLCNYLYIVRVRRRCAVQTRAQVAQFQAVSSSSGSATAAAGQPELGIANLDSRPAPTGGDHCCDDIDFDNI